MEHSIVVSEALFAALQHRARREQKPVDRLAADWLTQHLDLTSYPELEWREGPGGWRVGIRGTAIDVYSVVGYLHAGYMARQIAAELLPQLTDAQVSAALRFYAQYPEDIDRLLARSQDETIKGTLSEALGKAAYQRLTGSIASQDTLREESSTYEEEVRPDEQDPPLPG